MPLQRIETQQGFPRTMIAVEADVPAGAPTTVEAVEDATALKPVTVFSDSQPKLSVDEPVDTDEAPTSGDRMRLVWLVVGAVLLFVVGIVLFVRAGEDDQPTTPPPTPTASTPLSVAPDAPTEPPEVSGRRTAVVYSCDAPGSAEKLKQGDGDAVGEVLPFRRMPVGMAQRHGVAE